MEEYFFSETNVSKPDQFAVNVTSQVYEPGLLQLTGKWNGIFIG